MKRLSEMCVVPYAAHPGVPAPLLHQCTPVPAPLHHGPFSFPLHQIIRDTNEFREQIDINKDGQLVLPACAYPCWFCSLCPSVPACAVAPRADSHWPGF